MNRTRLAPIGKHGQVDWGIIPTIIKVVSVAVTIALAAVACAGAYYSIINRIDRIDDRMQLQAKATADMAESIKQLAFKAIDEDKLIAFCLQLQVANQQRGFVCHLSQTVRRQSMPSAAKSGG